MASSRTASNSRKGSTVGDDQSFFMRTPRQRSGFGWEIPIFPQTSRPSREVHHTGSSKGSDRSTASNNSKSGTPKGASTAQPRRRRDRVPEPSGLNSELSHRQAETSVRSDSPVEDESSSEEGVSVVLRMKARLPKEDSSSVGHSSIGGEIQSWRTGGIDRTVDDVYESINNKMLVPERLDWFLKNIEQKSDEQICKTYGNGIHYLPFTESAPTITIGLSFVPGVSVPQVARGEQDQMTTLEPDQKSAEWRHNTAASLLQDFIVTPQLEVQIIDQTEEILARLAAPDHGPSFFGGTSLALQKAPKGGDTHLINIDSQKVVVVDDIRRGTWDLKSTLIEVDGSSLIRLTVSYKHLISRGGPGE